MNKLRRYYSHHSYNSYQTGFTLMEVLASLVLLSLLVATLIPLWSRIRQAQVQMLDQLEAERILSSISFEEIRQLSVSGDMPYTDASGNNPAHQWMLHVDILQAQTKERHITPQDDAPPLIPSMDGQWVVLRIYAHANTAHDHTTNTPLSLLRYLPAAAPVGQRGQEQ